MPRRKSTSLTASLEFDRVYREGSVCRGRLFSVHTLPNDLGRPRLGLSVSRKVGGAVKRNGVRRRMKEIFYAAGASLPRGVDLVVSARPEAADAAFEELQVEFSRALGLLSKRANSGRGTGAEA